MLILAATPIGNLEDASLRLARVLKEADHVLRRGYASIGQTTQVFGDRAPDRVVSRSFLGACFSPNHQTSLLAGDKLVYISDAGMPGINDPGFELVRPCL